MSSPVILIGGFGFVGRNIIDVIQENNLFSDMKPIVVDDLSNACPGYETLDVESCIGPYQSSKVVDFLNSYNNKSRTFVFLAGETRVAESKDRPLDFIAANITEPSEFVMNVVKPHDHFILISTAGALFDGETEVSVDAPYSPKNFYGASKAAEEMILEKLTELKGAKFSIIRLTNVYGIHSDLKKSAIHAFTRACIDGSQVVINGDGQQSRDFIFSRDVGFGIATLANKVLNGEITHKINMLGSGVSTTLWDVVSTIENTSGKKLNYKQILAEDLIATEPRDVIANKDDIKVLLGEDRTAFKDGIRMTYEYYSSV